MTAVRLAFTHEEKELNDERKMSYNYRFKYLTELVASRWTSGDADFQAGVDILIEEITQLHHQDRALDGIPGSLRHEHRLKVEQEERETSLLLPLLCQWLFVCAVGGLILAQIFRWLSLPVDILLFFLGRSCEEKSIGRVEGFTYQLLSKEFPISSAQGNTNLVSQKFSGGKIEEFLKATS